MKRRGASSEPDEKCPDRLYEGLSCDRLKRNTGIPPDIFRRAYEDLIFRICPKIRCPSRRNGSLPVGRLSAAEPGGRIRSNMPS
ncbi:hypothetical protein AVEN_262464-1 [Araneus ventricosus]|uniref:Uncharacterized protein n=1 Tax=Araneus ventricosus TaxID=182803 RepID=A0A4Y2G8G9_ARAVE|nr:hypothetical protein AVEN_262464-1 [Araneus ventricosus]